MSLNPLVENSFAVSVSLQYLTFWLIYNKANLTDWETLHNLTQLEFKSLLIHTSSPFIHKYIAIPHNVLTEH